MKNHKNQGQAMNLLKRHIFFELMDLAGRAFLVVAYSERVIIGKRGFLPEEKEKGLVLVLNPTMNFSWDDDGVTAKLMFGATPHECYVPADMITAIYSPELNAQFVVPPAQTAHTPEAATAELDHKQDDSSKVVRVDFTKKKKT